MPAGLFSRIFTSCFSSAEGGMGFHYANRGLIDGAVAVNQPELRLYEPQKNGQLRLVAVEYIVPRQAWPGPGLPSQFGQTFSTNEAFDLYTLHVWIWQQNATGLSTGTRKSSASSLIRLTWTKTG